MFGSRAIGFGLSLIVVSSVFAGSPFDVNGDNFVNLLDYQQLASCLGGGGPGHAGGPECSTLHVDIDTDIDLADAAGFLNAFSGSHIANDSCSTPIQVGDGTRSFSNAGATTDGLGDPACAFFDSDQVASDLWYCYTATCTGTALISACGSSFDTKPAVYEGCGCPSVSPNACSDDDCGFGVENIQSRVEIAVTQGQAYMVRVGGYVVSNTEGDGFLTIGCDVEPCQSATHDCLSASPKGEPGCGDAECCAGTCALDWFCCDVTWDSKCAGEAEGICDGNFSACSAGVGACDFVNPNPGCNNQSCCNTICFSDPFCCLTEWDINCVREVALACFLTCGDGAFFQNCFEENPLPGCNNQECCETVCGTDPFCCDTEWDAICVGRALKLCP